MTADETEHLVILLVALIAAVPPTVAALAAWYAAMHAGRTVTTLDLKVNGRMDQLLEEARRAAQLEQAMASEMGVDPPAADS